jgi:hypothetical protein
MALQCVMKVFSTETDYLLLLKEQSNNVWNFCEFFVLNLLAKTFSCKKELSDVVIEFACCF